LGMREGAMREKGTGERRGQEVRRRGQEGGRGRR
jgi:hypothetical protein